MLGDSEAVPTIAVKDINAGKEFYGNKLGLKVKEEDEGGVTFQSGNGTLYMYESKENAGTNKATSVSWDVDDIAKTIEELKGKGVTFEHYDDLPGSTRDGDIHTWGDYKAAWFKDPDGTILAIGSK